MTTTIEQELITIRFHINVAISKLNELLENLQGKPQPKQITHPIESPLIRR